MTAIRADGTPHKVLIANRGEIACRVIRACREMGLPTVAVYSEADADAVHTWMADERVLLGAADSAESYLRADRVLAACLALDVTLVHPGYGFLSENADFREACDAAGVGFVGPSAYAMRQMGVKTLARETMIAAGVPVVPGTETGLADGAAAKLQAEKMGYPVMLKAANGGGGKGMRLSTPAKTSSPRLTALGVRRWRISATTRSIWRRPSCGRATSRCRSWRIPTATRCMCSTASAPCSGAIKR